MRNIGRCPVRNLDEREQAMENDNKKARKVLAALCKALAEILITVVSAVIAEAIIRLVFS